MAVPTGAPRPSQPVVHTHLQHGGGTRSGAEASAHQAVDGLDEQEGVRLLGCAYVLIECLYVSACTLAQTLKGSRMSLSGWVGGTWTSAAAKMRSRARGAAAASLAVPRTAASTQRLPSSKHLAHRLWPSAVSHV